MLHAEADYRNIPQSIRALRAAPGSSKLIAYRMTHPDLVKLAG
jgi:hypothetical protein